MSVNSKPYSKPDSKPDIYKIVVDYAYSTKNKQKLIYNNHDNIYKYNNIMIYLNNNIGLDKKLINYISFYSYILHNLFTWTRTDIIMCGQPKNNTINYGIVFDITNNIYYKNFSLLKNKNYDCSKNNILLLTKDEILELSKTSDNFRMCLNKLLSFLHAQQILFWKYSDKIEIEIPEYNISFYYNTTSETITFGNYIVYVNFKHNNDTKLIFNLIGNTPNTFIMYNEQDNNYFILNISRFSHFNNIANTSTNENINKCKKQYIYIKKNDDPLNCIDDDEYNEIFYYDILEVHYSNLFINFKDDITLMNYINTIYSNSNNYLIINLLKDNQFISNIFNNKDTNPREKLIIKHLQINNKNLYENHINKYIKDEKGKYDFNTVSKLSNIFKYQEEFDIINLVDGIADNYIILKYYIDLLYLQKYYIKLLLYYLLLMHNLILY